MILREMPDIGDDRFRLWFYAHWGRENCIIVARTRNAEYPLFEQRLSVKAARDGCEDYFIEGRRAVVDDETYLILNDRRTYASRIASRLPVLSFSIFFRPGMAEDVARARSLTHERLLDDPVQPAAALEFSEHVRQHDRQITPVLQHIFRHVEAGETREDWYEDQLYFLLQRMLQTHGRDRSTIANIRAARPGTRRELYRRIGLALDYINAYYGQPITMEQIAAAARLSPFHCLRVFRSVHGTTPMAYLNDRRLRTAKRLLRNPENSVTDIASLVGFQSRTTLFRGMRRVHGAAPTALRDEEAPHFSCALGPHWK
jgi:AraC-like DNA-binding protein